MLSRNLIRVLLGFLLAGHAINLLLLSTSDGRRRRRSSASRPTASRWPTRSRRR